MGDAAWVVRAGRGGEREDAALDESFAIAGWMELGDLTGITSRAELDEQVRATYPGRSNGTVGNWIGQLDRFLFKIKTGDLVVLPVKNRGPAQLAIGRIAGDYEFRASASPGFRHVRPVTWLCTDLPKSAVGPDLASSLGSLQTVFGLRRHGAVRRLERLAADGVDPGPERDTSAAEAPSSRDELLEQAADGESIPPQLTIRQLLALWDSSRRTSGKIAEIEADLADRGLTTDPPFTKGWIDNIVRIVPVTREPEPDEASMSTTDPGVLPAEELPPLSLRVGDLESANHAVMGVQCTDTLALAVTHMLKHDYSQLAVFGPGNAVRAVSWESISKASMAAWPVTLAAATVAARIVDHDADLLDRVREIYSDGYILVRASDGAVTGIVTTSDLTLEFAAMAQPVALIGEIERRLRRRVGEVFTLETLKAVVRNPAWIKSAADYTLGNYKHLLIEPSRFEQLGWALDHNLFVDLLEQVRTIRNELMHFSTDRLPDEDLTAIESMLKLLRIVDPRP